MNWQQLAASSHYQTAVKIARELEAGNVAEASAGLEELIDAVGRSERRALRSQLTRLMMHILKWQHQPARRSASWVISILLAREEIAGIQEEVPSLNQQAISDLWEKCLESAHRQAAAEIGETIPATELTWQQVFEDEYRVEAGS